VVAHPGAAGGPGRARPFDVAQGRQLNQPRPLRVEAAEDGRPIAVWLSGRRHIVETVLENWRIVTLRPTQLQDLSGADKLFVVDSVLKPFVGAVRSRTSSAWSTSP